MRIHPLWLLVFMASPAMAEEIDDVKSPANQAIIESANRQLMENRKLPPCEGLERNTAMVLNREIPKSCPNAMAFQVHLKKLDAKIRSVCPGRAEKISSYLRDSSYCENNSDDAAYKWARESRQEIYSEWNQFDVENHPNDLQKEECQVAWSILYYFRKRQTDISKELNNLGEDALLMDCINHKSSQEYFDFLQRGAQ